MLALLIGVGALFLAVFVSAILDPRWSLTRSAPERTRAADGGDRPQARGRPAVAL